MNLWFRLFLLLLGRPWRRPIAPMGTTVVHMRAWPLDLDFNRHVTNGRYFTLADIGRLDYVFRSGAFRVALRHKAIPIVGDVWGKFRKELKIFESFQIHTRVLGWDDKWTIMEHLFVRKGKVLGVVYMRGLFRARNGTVPPREFATSMGTPLESPDLPAWVKGWGEDCDLLSAYLKQSANSVNSGG